MKPINLEVSMMKIIGELKAEVARLKDEVERLTKAGDAMDKLLSCCGNPQSEVPKRTKSKGDFAS